MKKSLTFTKFVGTISLGLLTGMSYGVSAIALPSLALLPSAATASQTLSQIQTATVQRAGALSFVATTFLLACYANSPSRAKHPYLIWTALTAAIAGFGVDYYYNRFETFKELKASYSNGSRSYVLVDEEDEAGVNGEKVEMEMNRERKVQGVRAVISGIGFVMGVVGIWGDGA